MGLSADREADLLVHVAKARRALERAEATASAKRETFEEAVVAARQEGVSERTIAVAAGVGRRAIYDIRQKHGVD